MLPGCDDEAAADVCAKQPCVWCTGSANEDPIFKGNKLPGEIIWCHKLQRRAEVLVGLAQQGQRSGSQYFAVNTLQPRLTLDNSLSHLRRWQRAGLPWRHIRPRWLRQGRPCQREGQSALFRVRCATPSTDDKGPTAHWQSRCIDSSVLLWQPAAEGGEERAPGESISALCSHHSLSAVHRAHSPCVNGN